MRALILELATIQWNPRGAGEGLRARRATYPRILKPLHITVYRCITEKEKRFASNPLTVLCLTIISK